MSKFEIKGKVALVTGANRGIGKGYVQTLVAEGVKRVYATARNLDSLKELVAENPEVIVPILLDVTNPTHIAELKEKIEELDILVNNAGILTATGLSNEDTLEAARQEMETNYFGPLQLIVALIPVLKNSKEAAIINLSSIAGISNLASIGTYSVSKAAVHSYTQGLRAELSKDNIRVVGVYPGPIDTRMAEAFEMEKPKASVVAVETFKAVRKGENEVFPDGFSTMMYEKFLSHPRELEHAFAEMAE